MFFNEDPSCDNPQGLFRFELFKFRRGAWLSSIGDCASEVAASYAHHKLESAGFGAALAALVDS